MHAFDRRTDGRTDRNLIARPRLHSMQRGKNRCTIKSIKENKKCSCSITKTIRTRCIHSQYCGWCSQAVTAVQPGQHVLPHNLCRTGTQCKVLPHICLYCFTCMKFDQLIIRRIIRIVAARCQILRLKCTKCPRPHWRAYSTPQTPSWI